MKKLMRNIMALTVFVFAQFPAGAAQIETPVIVRQQWPWSTDVHVEYKLSGVSKPVDIKVQMFNGDEELVCADPLAITGRRHGIPKDGVGLIVIDPVKAFGTGEMAIANFKVRLTVSESTVDMDEVLYKIFDLTNGGLTDVRRWELLDGKYGAVETDFGRIGEGYNTSLADVLIWTGVTNDVAYKTTKLVMRKIPAKGVSTRIGRLESQPENKNDTSPIREVSFTNNYFMSVFELTEGQFLSLVTNTVGSTLTAAGSDKMLFNRTPDRYLRPVNVPDFIVRSNLQKWPSSGASGKGEFPDDNTTFIGNLRKQTKMVGFDLPTEAVWEYACRAGTTSDFNSGLNYSSGDEFARLARCSQNSGAGASGSNAYNSDNVYALSASEGGSAIVGSYRPNAWGLYDMHGNLMEMCLDRWSGEVVSGMTGPDPWGPPLDEGATDLNRVFKGGVYYLDGRYSASSYRSMSSGNNSRDPRLGVRICLTEF